MNLILSSPHGGKLKPFQERVKDNRTGQYGGVTFLADKYTKEISIGVIKQIQKTTGRRPHFIVNNVYRNCLDPNRNIEVGAQKNPEAVIAFKEYHAFINEAMSQEGIKPHLKISSSGAGLTSNIKHRMGDYYLSVKRYNDFPVYVKLDNSQVVFVNDYKQWSISSKLQPKRRSLRNKEDGGPSPSPPVGGWEYLAKVQGRSRWVKDPDMKVELMAPPYVTVSYNGARRVKFFHNEGEIHNDHPVYKKEDNSEVMFVNNENEWVVFNTIDPKDCTLRSTFGLTATPPQDGWQFCDNSKSDDESKLRVDPPSVLLIDMHGHNHAKNASEIGYLLNAKQLNDSSYKAEDTGIFGLIQRSGMSAAQMIHGPESLGAMFNEAGYAAFPSPEKPSPGKDKYFNGGYTLGVHGSRDHGGPADALQVEFPSQLRRPEKYAQSIRDRLVLALADIFQQFHKKYYDNN